MLLAIMQSLLLRLM
jgi:hypothetical protein